jgi:hypothetical protein
VDKRGINNLHPKNQNIQKKPYLLMLNTKPDPSMASLKILIHLPAILSTLGNYAKPLCYSSKENMQKLQKYTETTSTYTRKKGWRSSMDWVRSNLH